MNYSKKMTGKLGEDYACEYLMSVGHRILCRNYSCRCGEIDIISEFDSIVVFTEVKTRRNIKFGMPAEAVTSEKIRHILRTATWFFKEECVTDYDCRFDVIEVGLKNKDMIYFNHIRNAFDAGGF